MIGDISPRAAHVCDREDEPNQTAEQRTDGGEKKDCLPTGGKLLRFGRRIRIQRKKRHAGERGHRGVVEKPRDDESEIDHQRATLNEKLPLTRWVSSETACHSTL